MKTTYAIVDIETTGTDPKVDRMIQFGCVLVEKNKIVGRYATDINPAQKISRQIQNLTQISNWQVKKAPYFEDIAPTIYHLLSGTVFVAHNIHFDYQFLNQELRRCGMPPLTISGIDTVELSQIFLPTEPSYRLNDLAESLGITHENPHQAASDAEVTANLLIAIEKQARNLPLVTLEKIATLSEVTSYQTSQYLKYLAEDLSRQPKELAEDLIVVAGIALKKKEVPLYNQPLFETNYPKTKKDKERLFQQQLTYRPPQGKLMNLIHKQLTTVEEKVLLIEAATGMGKTIGYLLPLSYQATPEKPVIISTASILLQHQLMDEDIPKLNQFLEHKIQATLVKSKSHYIDLQRFKVTLEAPIRQKQYGIYQMRLLVWLTQTQTGDFGELNLTSLKHLLFDEIKHRGIHYLSKSHALYQVDFLRHLEKKKAQSNFLIVNHAFLAQETQREQPYLPASETLLIDEAHHLPDLMEQVANQFFDTENFHRKYRQYQEEGQLFDRLTMMLGEEETTIQLLSLYQQELTEIIGLQEEIFAEWFRGYPVKEDIYFQKAPIELSKSGEKNLERLCLYYDESLYLQKSIAKACYQYREKWLKREKLLYGELLSFFDELQAQADLVKKWLTNWSSNLIHKVYIYGNQKKVRLQLIDLSAAILPNTKWYARYNKILLVGGTLKVAKSRDYFARQLGVPEAKLKVIPAPYDYQQQARLFVLDESVAIHELSVQEYVNFLVQMLSPILESNPQSTLVLFTSHEVLKKVYYQMQMTFLENGREIMAQGIGGSREKLLKRFRHTKGGILFGADSFWEGVDLPGDTLQLLLVTRLPFAHPQRPMIEAKTRYFEEQGFNYFKQEALPKAALKLRQGLGRLIRSDSDRGVMVILDNRFTDATYSQLLQSSLPKDLVVEKVPLKKMLPKIKQFLQNEARENEKEAENRKNSAIIDPSKGVGLRE
ncbi:helicase C-terminal domain-containing protein [Enterococcus sp. LJL98]